MSRPRSVGGEVIDLALYVGTWGLMVYAAITDDLIWVVFFGFMLVIRAIQRAAA